VRFSCHPTIPANFVPNCQSQSRAPARISRTLPSASLRFGSRCCQRGPSYAWPDGLQQLGAVQRPKRTTDELRALIKPVLYSVWPVACRDDHVHLPNQRRLGFMISPGKSPQEEAYRVSALWVAVQMQTEFDLRSSYLL
jgi:hypothetical protein